MSRHLLSPTRMLLVGMDLMVLGTCMVTAVLVRWWFGGQYDPLSYVHLLPGLLVFVGLFWREGLYDDLPPGPSDELRRLTIGTTIGFLIFGAATFLFRGAEHYSRLALFFAWALTLFALPLGRGVLRHACAWRPWWGIPVIILGAGRSGHAVAMALQRNPGLGLKPVAFADDDVAKHGTMVAGVLVVGAVDDAPRLAAERGVRCALAAMPGASPQRLHHLWNVLGPNFPHLVVIPGLFGFASLWVEAKDLGGILGLELRQSLLMTGPRVAKRTLDLALVILGLIVISPIMLGLIVLIRIDSRGPIFYGQIRLGRGSSSFKAWKFRSMRSDADQILSKVLAESAELRVEWERDHKLRQDPRITRVGRFLRITSLDELPQLWNVLIGEMSLVGPRPIVQAEVIKYAEQFTLYERVRPGITGLWQVSGRNNTTYPERVGLDAFYVRNWSPWLDVWILARTMRTVILREGAF